MDVAAVPGLEFGARDSFRRIFGMEVEGKPVDRGAEPALEPLGPLEADVAERSNVVAPDRDRMLRHGDSLPGRSWAADAERRRP